MHTRPRRRAGDTVRHGIQLMLVLPVEMGLFLGVCHAAGLHSAGERLAAATPKSS